MKSATDKQDSCFLSIDASDTTILHTYLLIAMNQHNAQRSRLQLPASNDIDVVPLTNVVDVDGDGGVGADAVLLHQADQFTLSQVVWWARLTFYKLHLLNVQ